MPFSEILKTEVKRRAHFTCCYCQNRENKVDVHHIVPQSEGGSDTEDNAAPLCGSCHDKYGGNPDLRKEIRGRRDQWYEICAKQFEIEWPIGRDVPLLGFAKEIPSTKTVPNKGIQFTDWDTADSSHSPSLYLSIHFKTSRFFGANQSPLHEKWLYIQADMRFALGIRIQVRAWNKGDELELRNFLRKRNDGWSLQGLTPNRSDDLNEDVFYLWRENRENRLLIATYTRTSAMIPIHARLADKVMRVFDDYLGEMGFADPVNKEL